MFIERKNGARFYCAECSYYFREPRIRFERHGFTYGPYEKLLCCPRCGMSDYIEEGTDRAC